MRILKNAEAEDASVSGIILMVWRFDTCRRRVIWWLNYSA